MKRIFTLVLSAMSICAMAETFVTPGTGKNYGFGDIAKLNACVVETSPNTFLVSEAFTVAAGDTLSIESGAVVKLANGVEVTVEGDMIMTPAVQALITRADEASSPKGFYVKGDNSHLKASNLCVEYAQMRQFTPNGLLIENCTFRNTLTKATSASAIVATKATETDNIIRNCKFIKTGSAVFSTGANVPCGVQFVNNYIYDCNTGNSNRPMVNLTVGGSHDVVVKDNVIIGTGRTKVGAITVANLMGLSGTHNVIVENNAMNDCRYGVNIQGYNIKALLKNNSVVNNHYEPTPNNGGSGFSLYGPINVMATGNYIEGSLWGVTVIGDSKSINFGKTEDPTAEDYNPGLNVFKNNGNDGSVFDPSHVIDMFNNSGNETVVYAQGNIWSSELQDSLSVQPGIHDSLTDGHGRIIFMTPNAGAATKIQAVTKTVGENGMAFRGDMVTAKSEGRINIYNLNGMLIKSSMSGTEGINVSAFQSGTYVVRNMQTGEAIRFAK